MRLTPSGEAAQQQPHKRPYGFRRLADFVVPATILLSAVTLIVTFVVPDVFRHREEPRALAARQMVLLGQALDAFQLDIGEYPTSEQGLLSLWAVPSHLPQRRKWRGGYVSGPMPGDPWGRPYVYRRLVPGERHTFELSSYGADGAPGGTGEAADIIHPH